MAFRKHARIGDTITIGNVTIKVTKGSPTLEISAPKSMLISVNHDSARPEKVELGQTMSVEDQRKAARFRVSNNKI